MTHTRRPRCVTVVVSADVFALFVIAIAAAASRCCLTHGHADQARRAQRHAASRRAEEEHEPHVRRGGRERATHGALASGER